jgi:excisionase family DNA binding protein
MEANEEMSVEAVAEAKGVSRRAVYAAIHTGKLPARRVVGRWVIRRADLVLWEPVGHRPRRRRP